MLQLLETIFPSASVVQSLGISLTVSTGALKSARNAVTCRTLKFNIAEWIIFWPVQKESWLGYGFPLLYFDRLFSEAILYRISQ